MKSLSMVYSGSGFLAAPPRTPTDPLCRRRPSCIPFLPIPPRGSGPRGVSRSRHVVLAFGRGGSGGACEGVSTNVVEKLAKQGHFASLSPSSSTHTSSVGTSQFPVSPPSSSIGSPLFWIGVGVGFSALFSWAANYLKKYAMQQAFKTMMGQMAADKGQFSGSAAFPGQPFPFPSAPPAASTPMSPPPASQPVATVDIPAAKVESVTPSEVREDDTYKESERQESRKNAFIDVSPEEVSQASSSEGFRYSNEASSVNGSAVKEDRGDASGQSQSGKSSLLSVEALEKMMEDPTVQKMVFPYLPPEMRDPVTFKWMLQNPQYRQQLQDMLDNMSGSSEWDKQIMESLKNFDLSSPEVKQQFDQIGLSPEEVISKIMANPEIAMSFQNPKVQAAIMDCSENPMNINKYQNDKEIMDVFHKISELFPGVSGPF